MKYPLLFFSVLLISFCMNGFGDDIADLDKNFRPAAVGELAVNYFNAFQSPFELTGFPWRKEGAPPYRLPPEFTEKEVSPAVLRLAVHCSGGILRFRTDSPYLTIRAVYRAFYDMDHMARTGSAGFDLYATDHDGEHFITTVQPRPHHASRALEQRFDNIRGNSLRTYSLYLPLYSGLQELEIGLCPGSRLLAPPPQKIRKPILFYGSSITQGACASRPANCYSSMLCRTLDAPQINLGFSGNALGEPALAKAIAGLELSAMIYDYDFNAPSPEHLQQTHEKFFRIIRCARPNLPVIILSRCSWIRPEHRNIIRKTYENARRNGDRNVWFIDGESFFSPLGDGFCTVDRIHPNDLGFFKMYRKILPVLKKALDTN